MENLSLLAQYNFWDGNFPNLGYLRNDYLDVIMDSTGNKLVKVLVGQRRVGKSYLLRQLIYRLIKTNEVAPKNTLFINKELTAFDTINDYKDLENLVNEYKNKYKPKGKIWLFIDEIQNIEGWEHFVNSYAQNYREEWEIFITGSNSKLLSGELATLLSGRYITFEIFPFSFLEFSNSQKKEQNKQNYIEYMNTGALPELFVLSNRETKRNYTQSVKNTVLLRDIIQRHQIKDPKLLEDIFIYLVNSASNLISITNIVQYFKGKGRKTTYDTVANYIRYIEDTFLIHRAERFDIRGKETISGNCKFYINDLAFKNYLYAGFGYGLGYQLENLIYLDLRRLGYDVYTGSLRNKEVDFVAQKGEEICYIQVAYILVDDKTIQREYGALETIKDNYPKIVVSMDDMQYPSNKGIQHIQAWNLYRFLAKKEFI